jgi:YD repeat-containing protein
MDRRQLLFGMTALGLAGSLNLNELVSAQGIGVSDQGPNVKRIYPPDVELNEPRGPVKMCLEETIMPDGSVMTDIREYSPEGKMVSSRMERDGRLTYSSADRLQTEVRDDQGRLVKSVSGDRGGQSREYSYTYDNVGRMLTIVNNETSDRTEYHYGSDGVMTSIQTFDPKTIERTRNAAFAGSAWDAATSGFGVPTGGRVIISYDKNGNGTEMRVLAPDGQLVTQIVRKYDVDSRLLEEKPLQRNIAFLMLDRMSPEERARFTPEQIAVLNEGMAGKKPSQTTYTYDQGRLVQTLDRNMVFEKTKTIRYNDHGDKIEERTAYKENSVIPIGVPYSFDKEGNLIPTGAPEHPERSYLPTDSEARYAYRYDSYGNWTERTETRDGSTAITTRRTLTYH